MATPDPPAEPIDRRDPGRRELIETAVAWRDADPDPVTRGELDDLLATATTEELATLFTGRLRFGTAGLRGPLGVGPNRMNRLVCRQSAAGLARALTGSVDQATSRGVVVAHDARHGSRVFARDIGEVLTAHGLDVHRIDGPAPTPLAAFAVRHLAAAAGVVVTASHNPPRDNGIKVYWSDGAQIVPPVDQRIANLIDEAAHAGWDHSLAETACGQTHDLGPVAAGTPLVEAYLDAAGLLAPRPARPSRPLAATSLHGVGAELLELTLARHGHGQLHHVADQRQPDPEFPTVAFPNPEEPGAMDLVIALAAQVGADLALANDPDADRLALAAPAPGGSWRTLTGDEVGALLAWHLLELTTGIPDRLVATTVVSSRLLSAMAESEEVHFAETLTGFKWLCRPSLEHREWHQVITYEEALGYAVGPEARDKDGITAALITADLATVLHSQKRSVWDVLDDLARRYGAHVTSNSSVRLVGPDARERSDALAIRLEADPPGRLGGMDVTSTDTPAPRVLRLWLSDDTRVVLRPSGTEAKFKYYCEAIEPVAPAEHPEEARARARTRLDAVTSDLMAILAA